MVKVEIELTPKQAWFFATWGKLLGYTPEELIKDNLDDLINIVLESIMESVKDHIQEIDKEWFPKEFLPKSVNTE